MIDTNCELSPFQYLTLQAKLKVLRQLKMTHEQIKQAKSFQQETNLLCKQRDTLDRLGMPMESCVCVYLKEIYQHVKKNSYSMSDFILYFQEFIPYVKDLRFYFETTDIMELSKNRLFTDFLLQSSEIFEFWLDVLTHYGLWPKILPWNSKVDIPFRISCVKHIINTLGFLQKINKEPNGFRTYIMFAGEMLNTTTRLLCRTGMKQSSLAPISAMQRHYTFTNKRLNQAYEEDNPASFMIEMDLNGLKLTRALTLALIHENKDRILSELFTKGKRFLKKKVLKEILFAVCTFDNDSSDKIISQIEEIYPGFIASTTDDFGNNALWYCLHRSSDSLEKILIELGCDPHQKNSDLGLSYAKIKW